MTDTAHGGWPANRVIDPVVSDFEGTVKVSGSMSQMIPALPTAPITTRLIHKITQDYEGTVADTPIPPPPIVAATSAVSGVSASGAGIS